MKYQNPNRITKKAQQTLVLFSFVQFSYRKLCLRNICQRLQAYNLGDAKRKYDRSN